MVLRTRLGVSDRRAVTRCDNWGGGEFENEYMNIQPPKKIIASSYGPERPFIGAGAAATLERGVGWNTPISFTLYFF
jgi:hypothetical protein